MKEERLKEILRQIIKGLIDLEEDGGLFTDDLRETLEELEK